MSAGFLMALIGMIVGGAFIAMQAPINARLAAALGDGLPAAATSFAVGLVVLAPLALLRSGLPGAAQIASIPWWAWIGGVLGAFYVWMVILSVPVLGVVTSMAAMILGQLVAALLLDAVGAFGLPVQEVTWQRVLAVVLVAAGVILSRL